MNRTFKVFLILLTIFSSLIVLGSIFGGFLAHADSFTDAVKKCAITSNGFDHTYCWAQGIFYELVEMNSQNDKLIQLQEQENKLLAMQYCAQIEHYDDSCAPQVLNETK